MGLNVKLGKGGHGLEVYDGEGKYASEFSFDFEGQQIKGYDDFRALSFAQVAANSQGQFTPESLEEMYQNNPDFKDGIDGQLYNEYNRVLTEAVEDYNAKQIWDTPEDAAKHLHELFVPKLVQNLIENNFINSSKSMVASFYQVSTLAACVQMSRYKANRANVISRDEYDQELRDNAATDFGDFDHGLHKYITTGCKEHKSISLIRDISGVSASDRDTVFNSFFDKNSARHSCLAYYGVGYLGSVVYFAKSDKRYYQYGSTVTIRGLVKLNENLRLLECAPGGRSICRNAIPEIVRFKNAIMQDKDFDNRMIETFKKNGNVDDNQARQMLKRLKYEIQDDTGLSAILMGYDAIYGTENYQFDLLNLGILHVMK